MKNVTLRLFQAKGFLPDPKGSLARTIPSAIAAHFHPEFLSRDITQDVSGATAIDSGLASWTA